MTAYALPMTATLSVDGFVEYSAAGDGDSSDLDTLFFDNDWTYYVEFTFDTSLTGTPPAFSEEAHWAFWVLA